jgi:hypothetical protein
MKVKNIYGPFYFLANLYSTEYAQEKHYYNSVCHPHETLIGWKTDENLNSRHAMSQIKPKLDEEWMQPKLKTGLHR